MKTMLEKMIVLAVEYHSGQYDKGGNPYILHCLTVMHYLKTSDEELQCIAIGHDLFEDTDCTADILRQSGISERVINGIECLTKCKGETFDEYQQKVMSNHDSIMVKKCDLRHNSDIRRLKGVTEKDVARMVKYHNFYLKLCEIA